MLATRPCKNILATEAIAATPCGVKLWLWLDTPQEEKIVKYIYKNIFLRINESTRFVLNILI